MASEYTRVANSMTTMASSKYMYILFTDWMGSLLLRLQDILKHWTPTHPPTQLGETQHLDNSKYYQEYIGTTVSMHPRQKYCQKHLCLCWQYVVTFDLTLHILSQIHMSTYTVYMYMCYTYVCCIYVYICTRTRMYVKFAQQHQVYWVCKNSLSQNK